jgi:hypothetical protein
VKRMLPSIENLLYRRPKSSYFGSPQTGQTRSVISRNVGLTILTYKWTSPHASAKHLCGSMRTPAGQNAFACAVCRDCAASLEPITSRNPTLLGTVRAEHSIAIDGSLCTCNEPIPLGAKRWFEVSSEILIQPDFMVASIAPHTVEVNAMREHQDPRRSQLLNARRHRSPQTAPVTR